MSKEKSLPAGAELQTAKQQGTWPFEQGNDSRPRFWPVAAPRPLGAGEDVQEAGRLFAGGFSPDHGRWLSGSMDLI
ncbi:unnamed protein product [Caretta caretta]